MSPHHVSLDDLSNFVNRSHGRSLAGAKLLHSFCITAILKLRRDHSIWLVGNGLFETHFRMYAFTIAKLNRPKRTYFHHFVRLDRRCSSSGTGQGDRLLPCSYCSRRSSLAPLSRVGSTVIRVSRCPRQSCWLPQHTCRACRTTDRTRCHDLWTASRSALSRAGCRRSALAGHDCSSESYRRSRFRRRAGRESERGTSRSYPRISVGCCEGSLEQAS